MKNSKNLKAYHLLLLFLFIVYNSFSQQSNIKQGETLKLGDNVLSIEKLESSVSTPVNKTKAKSGNHFILISLKIIKIEKDKEFSSVQFILTDKANKKYTQPGAWGKIEVMGSLSNFEATEGATVYARKINDVLNLIFEVPVNILPNQLILQYDVKHSTDSNSKSTSNKSQVKGYSVDSINLFERGESKPQVAERYYTNSFFKEFARFIAVEVNFKNHLFQVEMQEYPIELVWYDTKGVIEGKQEGKIIIQADWKTCNYTSDGWGWKVPGKWEPGNYLVAVFIDKIKVAEEAFTIKEKTYQVETIKVFGYKDDRPERNKRQYAQIFNTDSIERFSVEVNLKNLLFEINGQTPRVLLKWYGPDEGYIGKQTDEFNIKPEWQSCYYNSTGYGYNDLGKWALGTYRVEVYLDNNLAGSTSFEIINSTQLTGYFTDYRDNKK
jgi:hypothetical protein